MKGGLLCSKALKDHKIRMLQRSGMVYYCCYKKTSASLQSVDNGIMSVVVTTLNPTIR